MTPETHDALISYLHPMAPMTEHELEVSDQEARADGFNERAIKAGRLYAHARGMQFETGIEVVRIIFGDEIAGQLRREATERQRLLEATD